MNIQQYYLEQSKTTSPGQYAYLYQDLPDEIPALCEIVQGLVMHYSDEEIYNYQIPTERYPEMDTRYVEDILQKIVSYDNNTLTSYRKPEHRMVGVCRDMSILLCSILRYKKIPARLRVGFANYFIPGLYLDGMCVEYWDKKVERWCYIDTRTSAIILEKFKLKLNFSLYDLPDGKFTSAAQAWQLCRSDQINPSRFGSRKLRGFLFLRNSLIQDLAVVNKKEILIWDTWGEMLKHEDVWPTVPESQLIMLDELATFMQENIYNIDALQEFYNNLLSLKVPEIVTVYNPFCDVRDVSIDV